MFLYRASIRRFTLTYLAAHSYIDHRSKNIRCMTIVLHHTIAWNLHHANSMNWRLERVGTLMNIIKVLFTIQKQNKKSTREEKWSLTLACTFTRHRYPH